MPQFWTLTKADHYDAESGVKWKHAPNSFTGKEGQELELEIATRRT
jgi:hypothetical protein